MGVTFKVNPKKLVKDKVSTPYSPRHLVIRQRSVIVDKASDVIVDALFSTPVLVIKMNHSVDVVEKLCLQEFRKGYKGYKKSNVGGWQSGNILDSDTPFPIIKDIEGVAQDFAARYLFIGKKIEIPNAWININGKKDSNLIHTHPGSILSGVYYVKTPKDCGNLVFHHPALTAIERDWRFNEETNHTTMNSVVWSYTPKEDFLYIFPSWIKHLVQPNMNSKKRISISFNVW